MRDDNALPAPSSPPQVTEPTDRTIVALGDFAVAGTDRRWKVWWDDATGTVHADAFLNRRPGCTLGAPLTLGRLPSIDYVSQTLAAIDAAHGGQTWRSTHGIQPLARWIAMVAAALDGGAWCWYHANEDGHQAHYLDHGHTRHDIDAALPELDAIELWQDLDDLVAQASLTINALTEALRADGNLAQAASLAQDLTESAVSIHLALNDAYRVAHQANATRRQRAPHHNET